MVSRASTCREPFLDAVAHGSAVAWQHLNLLGEYDFSDEKLRGWRGEGLSSEGEPEQMRFAGRADSIGRTYQDDSERSSRRKANEAETGWSQRAHKLQMQPAGQCPRYANFYVAFGTFVGI